ncbi:MAG: type II toxin-antitoxin system VapC family toxin [Candidatus Bathyarchaeia archaeon]
MRKMRLLFDASALLNTMRLYRHEAYKMLKGNLTLSLTRYEIGNVLWKETLLLKRLSIEEALEAASLLDKVLKIMVIADPQDSSLTLKLAYDLQITYYDASYIAASAENNARLITDDIKLIKKVQENTDIINGMLGKKIELSPSDKIQSPLRSS